MLEKYPKDLKIVHKNFPLRNHSFARKAAVAALAAGNQGKFWEFHDKIFENYAQLSDQKIEAIARELNMNIKRFNIERKDPAILSQIDRDLQDGYKADVKGTPTVFINGMQPKGRSIDIFSAIIEKELKRITTR